MKRVNMENRLSKRYIAKQKNADILLHHYYLKQIFQVWKKEYRVQKKLSKQINGKLLSTVLTAWQRYAIVQNQRKSKGQQISQNLSAKTMQNIFNALHDNRIVKQTEKSKVKQIQKSVIRRQMCVSMKKWLSAWMSLDNKRRLKSLSQQMRKRVYFRRYINIWKQKYNHKAKKNYLDELKT